MAAELSETDEHDFSDVHFDEKNVVYLQALFRGALVRKQFRELRLLYNTIVADTERNAHMTVDWAQHFSPKVMHIRKLRQKNQLFCRAKKIDIVNRPNLPENDANLSQKPDIDLNSLNAPHDALSELSNADICEKTSLHIDLDVQDDDILLDAQDSSLTVTKTISEHVNILNSPRNVSNFDKHHRENTNISSENIKIGNHFNSEIKKETEDYLIIAGTKVVTNEQPQSHPNIETRQIDHENSGSDVTLPEEIQHRQVDTIINDATNDNPDVNITKDLADASDDIIPSRDDDSYVQPQRVDNDVRSDDVRIPEQRNNKPTSVAYSNGRHQITADNDQMEYSTFPDMTSVWESCSSFKAPTLKSYPQDPKDLQELRKNMAMELLWIQQAIGSRKNYLRLKSQMNH